MEGRMAWLHDNGDEEELAQFDDEEDGEPGVGGEEETEEVIVSERMGMPAPVTPASGKSKPKPKSKAKPKAKAKGKAKTKAKAKAKAKPAPKKKTAKKATKSRKKR
jgi:hypothetical protein